MIDESPIARWRRHVGPRAADASALEAQLQADAAVLQSRGLDPDEAFLVALRRVARRDPASGGFAREHEERTVWRHAQRRVRGEAWVAVALAVVAALAIKLPTLAGKAWGVDEGFYARNLALFAFPLLAAFLAWKRAASRRVWGGLALAFAAAAAAANARSFASGDPLEVLIALHLPIALWAAIGVAHAGGRWRDAAARMDFARFSGGLFLWYVLIALGGAVLMAFTFALFDSLGLDAEPVFEQWLLPCGAMGAILIAAWLVDSRQAPAEHLAPLLTRLFTPLFTLLLLAVLATMAWTGRGPAFHREMLIAYDLLLAVVAGLVLYAIAGRDPTRPPGAFDALQCVLIVAALLVDLVALGSMAARIGEFGFTANRTAALGENLILFANLAGAAVLQLRFLRGRIGFARLEHWQTRFLPVYAGWAALVVLAFPRLF